MSLSFQKEAHRAGRHGVHGGHPDIAIELPHAAVENYEELVQANFREAITGGLPDVAFHGFNRVAFIAERGLAAPLEPFVAAEQDWASLGYVRHRSRWRLSMIRSTACRSRSRPRSSTTTPNSSGTRAAIPINSQGLARILELAKRIDALDNNAMGAFFDWTSSAKWEFIALVELQGGRMMQDGRISFDGPEGKAALELLRAFGEAGQVDMSPDQAAQIFVSGQLGILITSSARTMRYTQQSAGAYTLRTAPFPLSSPDARLPAGGNAGMILARMPRSSRRLGNI